MHDLHEHFEHAAHDGGHEKHAGHLPQFIGITVAILGVIMALCSAQVGAARTELIATMVEESAAKSKATAVANKYRTLQAQLQQLHAAMPDLKFQKKRNDEIRAISQEMTDGDAKKSVKISGLYASKILNTVTPTEDDVKRFLTLIDSTREENEAAKEWSESFRDAVKVHENTADRFELAMLAAEIGIVIASVGLLLAKKRMFARSAWLIAISLGIISLSVALGTKITNNRALEGSEVKIHQTHEKFENCNKDEKKVEEEDKKLEKDIVEEFQEMEKMEKTSEHS